MAEIDLENVVDVIALGDAFLEKLHDLGPDEVPDEAVEGVDELHAYMHASNDLLKAQQKQIESLSTLLNEECKRNMVLENKLRMR